jgi:hypothetical protein
MAESQPGSIEGSAAHATPKVMPRRRKAMVCIGALLSIVMVCVAAIVIMLQRLEARNASFQPPMTELERQRLLPPDPILDTAPRLNGLRYGQQVEPGAGSDPGGYSPVEHDPSQAQGALSHALMQHRDEWHAQTGLRSTVQSAPHQ